MVKRQLNALKKDRFKHRYPSWYKGYKNRFKRNDQGVLKYYNHDEYDDHCYLGWEYFTLGYIEFNNGVYRVLSSDNIVLLECKSLQKAKNKLIEVYH